jgi:hypothetical protein
MLTLVSSLPLSWRVYATGAAVMLPSVAGLSSPASCTKVEGLAARIPSRHGKCPAHQPASRETRRRTTSTGRRP